MAVQRIGATVASRHRTPISSHMNIKEVNNTHLRALAMHYGMSVGKLVHELNPIQHAGLKAEMHMLFSILGEQDLRLYGAPPVIAPPVVVDPPEVTEPPGSGPINEWGHHEDVAQLLADDFLALPGGDQVDREGFLAAVREGTDPVQFFTGKTVVVFHASGAWYGSVHGSPGIALNKASHLGHAANLAGPWGIVEVEVGEGGPYPVGWKCGQTSASSVAKSHAGPVLIRGGASLGFVSVGTGGMATWVHNHTVYAEGANAIAIHMSVAIGTPRIFSSVELESASSGGDYGGSPQKWHANMYREGRLGFVDVGGTATVQEHMLYVKNTQGGIYARRVHFPVSRRCGIQHTNRVLEGPPSYGTIHLRDCTFDIADKFLSGGGGGCITVSGHGGTVLIENPTFVSELDTHKIDWSHNALIVAWGEPDSANGGVHKLPSGRHIGRFDVRTPALSTTTETFFRPDREPIMLSSIDVAHIDMPGPSSDEANIHGAFGGLERAKKVRVGSVPLNQDVGTLTVSGQAESWATLEVVLGPPAQVVP